MRNRAHGLKVTSTPSDTTADRTHETATPDKSGRRKATGLTGHRSPRQPGYRMGALVSPVGRYHDPTGGTRNVGTLSSARPAGLDRSRRLGLRLRPAGRRVE